MQGKSKKEKRIKRIVSLLLIVTMLLSFLPVNESGFSDDIDFVKADPTYTAMTEDLFEDNSHGKSVSISSGIRSITINDWDDLILYSICYRDFPANNHDTDVITLSPTGGNNYGDLIYHADNPDINTTYGEFVSIGNDTKPFKGTLKSEAIDTININTKVPLFGTIDQTATLSFSQPLTLSRSMPDSEATQPVFANKIVNQNNSSTAMDVVVVLGAGNAVNPVQNEVPRDFAGVIGTMDANTSVNLTVTKSNTVAITSESSTVGYLCNTMGSNSVLTATLSNSPALTVTSTGNSKDAGGLVGEMGNGSQLILKNSNLNSVSLNVTGKRYAGGLVGNASAASIGTQTFTDASSLKMSIGINYKASSTTINGPSGAGYFFGRYENAVTDIAADGGNPARTIVNREFEIGTDLRQISVTFASNKCGGFFGVLENKITTTNTSGKIVFNGNITGVSSLNTTDVPGSRNITISSGGKTNLGGIIYKYKSENQANTLEVKNVYVYIPTSSGNLTYFGGVVSEFDNTVPAYVEIKDFYLNQDVDQKESAGLVYSSNNAFINVSGYVGIKAKAFSSGLVYNMNTGVLRLSGTTDLSNYKVGNSQGSLVYKRGSSLIYSKGSGSDSEWKLRRPNTKTYADDIYDWGSVLRLSKSGLTGNVVVDETNLSSAHKVTIPTVTPSAIADTDDFIRLALCVQLNNVSTENTTPGAAVEFTYTPQSADILALTTLKLTGDVDLTETGITGFTRDNGSNAAFSGTFDGNNHKITLAIGEAFGRNYNDTADVSNTNDGSTYCTGRSYCHSYLGLFARINQATVKKLTVDGDVWIGNNQQAGLYFGGIGAEISAGTTEFNTDKSNTTVYLYGDKEKAYVGGFVSRIYNSSTVTVNFTDCESSCSFKDNSGRKDQTIFFGGFLSMIAKESTNVTLNFKESSTGCIVSGSYETIRQVNTGKYGGLVSYIENLGSASSAWTNRKLNIEKLIIDGLEITNIAGDNSANFGCASLIGYEWYGADVTIKDLSVGNTSPCKITLTNKTGVKMAGLCTIATGHWQVDKVDIQKLEVSGDNSSFGMLINSAIRPKDAKGIPALYLELTDGSQYTINGDNSKVKITGVNAALFDEVAVYSYNSSYGGVGLNGSTKDITGNGASVISINTNSTGASIVMDGSSCNTYKNQTAFGKSITSYNPHSRYYYNLYTIRNKATKTDADKLMLWSVRMYAQSVIQSYFKNGSNDWVISGGNYDMTGYSYYPINCYDNSITFSNNTTLKFENAGFEAGEKVANSTYPRTSYGTSSGHTQHYLMHCGLFMNFVANQNNKDRTFSVKNITYEGNAGRAGDQGSGFLVCGTLGGGTSKTSLIVNSNSNNQKLNGAYVYNGTTNNAIASSDYLPLLVNNVLDKTDLKLYGVQTTDTSLGNSDKYLTKQQANTSWCAASSLIGKVGKLNGSSQNITIEFSKMTLDSRKTDNCMVDPADDSAYNNVYKTQRSIFSKATLLYNYIYNDNCSGTYNYTLAEDWGTGSGTAPHNVTYGQEVTYTVDNNSGVESSAMPTDYSASMQKKYLANSQITNPISKTYSAALGYYDFSKSLYLPYVGDYDKTSGTTHDTKYHELDVNLSVASLDVGCGTYNDPYVITDGDQLVTLAKVLKGETVSSLFVVNLPVNDTVNLPSGASTASTNVDNLYWCNNNDHVSYSPNEAGTKYISNDSTASSNEYSNDVVRTYLAGAYYQITNGITLSSKYAGLGGGEGKYAFRGVIVGKEIPSSTDPTSGVVTPAHNPSITNKSVNPLILTSNGCVLKDFDVDVNGVAISISQESPASTQFAYSAGCASYGVLIGKTMGGDNVIDNCNISLSNDSAFTLGSGSYIVPVGGYVGVVVNGGLFFRGTIGSGLTGAVFSDTTAVSGSKYLYINPYIGRVINGYAVYEKTSYSASGTLDNGTYGYPICDLNKNQAAADKLTTASSTITASNAQAWFVLSAIVNSGTGSTSGSAGTISYNATDFKSTHIGTYDDVGCKDDTTKTKTNICDSALFETDFSELANGTAVPYIINHYADSTANALTISTNTYNVNISGTWTLPNGYRGIGGFIDGSANNSQYQLYVNNVTGTNTDITLNMRYYSYHYGVDNYLPGNVNSVNPGFALFNQYMPKSASEIKNITLRGTVKTDVYTTSGSRYDFASLIEGDERGGYYLNASMLIGSKSNNNTLKLNGVSIVNTGDGVWSVQNSGGMIAEYAGTGKLTVEGGSTANPAIVRGGRYVGGLIGTCLAQLEIKGATSGTNIAIDHLVLEYGVNTAGNSAAGGLVGHFSNSSGVVITNYNVNKSGSNGYNIESTRTKDEALGGIIGNSGSKISVSNCTVNNISEKGSMIGGVIGRLAGGNAGTVSSVTVNGRTSGSGSLAILSQENGGTGGGGIAGELTGCTITISDCTVSNYDIELQGTGNVGGCVGKVDSNVTLNLKNYYETACTINAKTTNSRAAGGIIGSMSNNTSSFNGYNIALDTISRTDYYSGDLIGYYDGNQTVKVVGFSRTGTPTLNTDNTNYRLCSETIRSKRSTLYNGGYVVFADYSGVGFTGNKNTVNPIVTDSSDADINSGDISAAAPYVTVNAPYDSNTANTKIDDDTLLTGDGIAKTASALQINTIMNDLATGTSTKRYQTAYEAGAYSGFQDYTGKLSTLNTELGAGTVTNDFGILVLEDTNRLNSHTMINSYLQLLTNTAFDFGQNNNSVYTVGLYKMQLQNGTFRNVGAANLRKSNDGQFYMLNDKQYVDTGDTVMFSLIDVAFKDPTTSSNPSNVYHLYVPVLVKKMMRFKFEIATGSGTIYEKDWYDRNDRYGKIMLENLGMSGTLYFKYTYDRTCREWQDALNQGENFNISFDKVLNMSKNTESLPAFDDDTVFVLVDPNNGNRSYYSRFDSSWSANQLRLYENGESAYFYSSLEDGAGTGFSPVKLYDLMSISYATNENGRFVECSENAATVKANDKFFKLYVAADYPEETPTRYNLTFNGQKGASAPPENVNTSVPIIEDYYLSIFTVKPSTTDDDTINYYNISSPGNLSGGAVPTRAVVNQSVTVLFANLYTQSDVKVTPNPDDDNPALISAGNKVVKANLEAQLALTSSASAAGIASKLDDSVDIYQSFIVYLTRNENGTSTKAIVGSPAAAATYTITPLVPDAAHPELVEIHPSGHQKDELNYVEAAEYVSIKDYLKYTGGVKVAANLVLTYDTVEQRESQFPVDSEEGEIRNYASISANSNIAYDRDKTAYSKNQQAAVVMKDVRYHISSAKEATLAYNAVADGDGSPYGQLGINANDLEGNSDKVGVETIAVYNLEEVKTQVPISSHKWVKFTFTLQQKNQDTLSSYSDVSAIEDYLDSVRISSTALTSGTGTPKVFSEGAYIDETSHTVKYTYIFKREDIATNGDVNLLTIPIDFSVITGKTFENMGHMYGNFKILVTAECLESSAGNLSGVTQTAGKAFAQQYIIYTNAKLITDFIHEP